MCLLVCLPLNIFKENLENEKYANINFSHSERSVLAQARMGILPLHMETVYMYWYTVTRKTVGWAICM